MNIVVALFFILVMRTLIHSEDGDSYVDDAAQDEDIHKSFTTLACVWAS